MKKILFIIIFILLLFGFWQSVKAVDLLLQYPDIPGAQKPGQTNDLPQIINYIYKFSLLACGVTAFVSILVGAIQYVFSAGDASKASNAKDRITQALLGILILLAAVLILRTINPDLVNLSFSLPETTMPNTTENYKCLCCSYDIHGNGSCTPKTEITDTQYWPQACNKISSTDANTNCNLACHAKNCVLPLNDPQNQMIKCVYKLVSCQ